MPPDNDDADRRETDEEPRATYPFGATTPQEAQVAQILNVYGQYVEPGPENWREEGIGIQFFVRRDFLLVQDEYADRVRAALGPEYLPDPDTEPYPDADPSRDDPSRPDADSPADGTVAYGLQWVRLRPGTGVFNALNMISGARELRNLPEGAAEPEYVVYSAQSGNTGTKCPADEPTPVLADTPLDPLVSCDSQAGAGVRVVVLDTGLDPAATGLPWMQGVRGDPDPGIDANQQVLQPYAGHGTFIAGIIRCVAPAAEVVVRAAFPPLNTAYAKTPLALTFEWQLVTAIEQALVVDNPDVISLSAGTFVLPGRRLSLIHRFYQRKLSRYKGVVVVAAAGNDHRREPFYPAAERWAVSAGALSANCRGRAYFTNHGGWVDAYAPGENLVNAFPSGTLAYLEPPRKGNKGVFAGLARWSGTSFATPVVAGLIAARMSRTGEGGEDAARAVIEQARRSALPGVGAIALPEDAHGEGCCCPRPSAGNHHHHTRADH
jgi:subtilisin family serine protease